MDCVTPSVVYLLTCVCGDVYIGKTQRPFNSRISEHIRDIRKVNLDTPLGRHAAFKHGHKNGKVFFRALDHVHPHPRGGATDKQLLRL